MRTLKKLSIVLLIVSAICGIAFTSCKVYALNAKSQAGSQLLLLGSMVTPVPTAIPTPTPTPDPNQTLYIIHSSDLHETSANISKLSTLIKTYKREHANVLALDCGDMFDAYGTNDYHGFDSDIYRRNYSNETGRAMAEIMGAIPYDAMILGNHDYSLGLKRLGMLIQSNNLPVLGANVMVNTYNVPLIASANQYKKFDFNGFSVGVVGACSTINHYEQWDNQTNDFVAARLTSHYIHNAVNAARAACDLVVIATHQNWSSNHYSKSYNEAATDTDLYTLYHLQNINYVAASHDHRDRYTNYHNIYMAEVNEGGAHVSIQEIHYDCNAKNIISQTPILKAVSGYTNDPVIDAILEEYPVIPNNFYSRKFLPDL